MTSGNSTMEHDDRSGFSLAHVESAGGWRHFLRVASEAPSEDLRHLTEEDVIRHPTAVLALIFAEAKEGDVEAARCRFDLWHDTLRARAKGDPRLVADLVLVDAHLSIYEDRTFGEDAFRQIEAARSWLADGDLIGRALHFNLLCNMTLQMGDLDQAQKNAEEAIRLYKQADAAFGALHLHTHLAQIRLMRGDLRGATEVLHGMEAELANMPGQSQWLLAVARILRAEVTYEANDIAQSKRLCQSAFDVVEHKDAWFDILIAAYRVNTRLAHAESGLPGALEALSHGDRVARERKMPRLSRLLKIERLRALTLSGETRAATQLMSEIGLHSDRANLEESDDLALRQGTTFVAIARLLVRTRRAAEALEFIGPAEDLAIRRGQLLPLAKLRVISAAAHWKLGARTEATSSLLSAIRLLGDQPFSRFIIDEGPEMRFIVQAALDGDHVSVPPTRAQRRRLSELMHHWATERQGFGHSDLDGNTDLHRRYLQLVALGNSNKEIARVMGVSINTVKFHLKRIFRELDADNRVRAVQRARDLGILES